LAQRRVEQLAQIADDDVRALATHRLRVAVALDRDDLAKTGRVSCGDSGRQGLERGGVTRHDVEATARCEQDIWRRPAAQPFARDRRSVDARVDEAVEARALEDLGGVCACGHDGGVEAGIAYGLEIVARSHMGLDTLRSEPAEKR